MKKLLFSFILISLSVPVNAADPISLKKGIVQSLASAPSHISGAHSFKDRFFAVSRDNDSVIYQMNSDRSLTPLYDLKNFKGYYSVGLGSYQNKLRFSGISYCPAPKGMQASNRFFIIQEDGTHVLEVVLQQQTVIRHTLSSDQFTDEISDGTMSGHGIAVDCDSHTIYISKNGDATGIYKTQRINRQWHVTDKIEMDHGDSPEQEGIFDIQFHAKRNELFVLQKNQANVAVIPLDAPQDIQNYTYKATVEGYADQTNDDIQWGREDGLAVIDESNVRLFINGTQASDSLIADIQIPRY